MINLENLMLLESMIQIVLSNLLKLIIRLYFNFLNIILEFN